MSIAFHRAKSLSDGFCALKNDSNILLTRTRGELTDEMAALKKAIIAANRSIKLRGILSCDPSDTLRDFFGSAARHIPISFEQAEVPGRYFMRMENGAPWLNLDDGGEFALDVPDLRRYFVTHLVIQSNSDGAFQPKPHRDPGDTIISAYLDGYGLKIRDPDTNLMIGERVKGAVVDMLRGTDNEQALYDQSCAAEHTGFSYANGETRASIHINLSKMAPQF